MEIKLKDLVWKEIDKKEKMLKELKRKWATRYSKYPYGAIDYFIDNLEDIAKEKQEIINRPIEYTKQDIIDMFVEVGFGRVHKTSTTLIYTINKYCLYIILNENYFDMELGDEESSASIEKTEIYYNDRKRIEFYYNKFREILEFEVKNGN